MKKFLLVAALSVLPAQAAQGPSVTEIRSRIYKALKDRTPVTSLSLSLREQYGGKVIAPLTTLVNNESESEETRWASLYAIARLSGSESVGLIKKFMNHSNWLLRDAALKTAAAVNATSLSPQIAERLKDDALIIRTSAVNAFGHLKLTALAPKLVDSLFDPVNYNKGKPLWIHRHILSVLGDFQYKAAIPKLVELLDKNRDGELQGEILASLSKITGKNFESKPLAEQKMLWRRIATAEKEF